MGFTTFLRSDLAYSRYESITIPSECRRFPEPVRKNGGKTCSLVERRSALCAVLKQILGRMRSSLLGSGNSELDRDCQSTLSAKFAKLDFLLNATKV